MTMDSGTPPAPTAGPRGRLEIAPVVVRKIAQHVADTAPGTTPGRRRIAGVGLGTHGAHARVHRDGNTVDLTIDLALTYPATIPDVADQVRAQVTSEITRMTAYRVRTVNITISALLPLVQPRVE